MTEVSGNTGETTAQNDDGELSIDNAIEALLSRTQEDLDTPNDQEPDEADAKAEAEEDAPDQSDDAEPEDDDLDAAEDEAEDEEVDPTEEDTEEGDDQEPEDEETDDSEYLFEVDGEKVNLEEARLGWLRQSDYTKKAQQLAEDRKAIEAQKQQLLNEQTQYQQVLETLKQQISGPEPDWATLEQTEDPVTVLQMKEAYREQQSRVEKIAAEQERIANEQQSALAALRKETIHKETEALLDKVPEWRDETVASNERKSIREFMNALGFSDQEAENVLDHRVVLALRYAVKGYQMETQKKPLARKKAAKAKPSLKPGSSSKPATKEQRLKRQAKDRFHQSGDLHDAVNFMLARS